jgi:hypothetical protein
LASASARDGPRGVDGRRENAHEDAGSRDRPCRQYGYLAALKRALAMLIGRAGRMTPRDARAVRANP